MKLFRILTAAAILLSAAGNTLSQDTALLEVLHRYATTKNFNGVVVVSTNGRTDFIGSAGIADRQNSVPVTNSTRFRIASVTKTFTAVLVLKLHEQGKLELDVPFGRYLPEYKGEAKNRATIHHLLTYSSGIPDQTENLGMTPFKIPLSPGEFVDRYCSAKPETEPGTKSVYSNTEYMILGLIIEKISGKSYADALRDEILKPLAMNDSGLANARVITKNLAAGYVFNEKDATFGNDEPYHPENYSSAGAMYSTAEDLVKFDAALFGGKLLRPATLEKMLKTNPTLGDAAYGMWGSGGFGNFDEPFYYRPGGILGSNANWLHAMKTGKSVIVLSNTNATNLFEMSEQLYIAAKKQIRR